MCVGLGADEVLVGPVDALMIKRGGKACFLIDGPAPARLKPMHQAAALTKSEAASWATGGPDGWLPSEPPSGGQPTFLFIKPLAAFIGLIALHFLSYFCCPCPRGRAWGPFLTWRSNSCPLGWKRESFLAGCEVNKDTALLTPATIDYYQ